MDNDNGSQHRGMKESKADSLRSVLSYYESNIASSQDSASKSFLANIVASSPDKRFRRRSIGALPQQQPVINGFEQRERRAAPKHMSRRASWCSGTPSSTANKESTKSLTKSPREETAGISNGIVVQTKALFEGLRHQTSANKPRRSSVGPGVEVLSRPESIARFEKRRTFWATLPKPTPTTLKPRFPRQWSAIQSPPQTIRDIALKAAKPTCSCPEAAATAPAAEEGETETLEKQSNHCLSSSNSLCSSCGLDTLLDADEELSVVSSAVCVFDGENLYLPLQQGTMVFRPNGSGASVDGPIDQQPQMPCRHGSMAHGLPSTRSIGSFTSLSISTPPRRVRIAEENNEVWFFEVDDLASVFSEDGLELDQDFASIFDGRNDMGPRPIRRRDSGSAASVSSWEYVGFYDEVKLPQDFGSTFTEGQGEDSVPRLRSRRGSLEKTPSLLDIANKDKTPQITFRRNSIEMEDFSFDDEDREEDIDFEPFVPPVYHSPVRRIEGIRRPVREAILSPQYSKSPMGSLFAGTQSPDRIPKVIRRRQSIEQPSQSVEPALLKNSSGPVHGSSQRQVDHQISQPTFGDMLGKSTTTVEIDATTVSTTTTHGEEALIKQTDMLDIPIFVKGEVSRRTSVNEHIPTSEFTVETSVSASFNAPKGSGLKNEKRLSKKSRNKKKKNRRVSTRCSSPLRPTKIRGRSFERDSADAQSMARVFADFKKDNTDKPPLEKGNQTKSSLESQPRSRDKQSHFSKRNFLRDQASLRPALLRGYSFSDDEYSIIFDDLESTSQHSYSSSVYSPSSTHPVMML